MSQKKMGAGQGAHINYINSAADHTAPAMRASNEIVTRRVDGALVVDSRTIADEFGRRHDNVMATLRDLIRDGTINALDFKDVDYRDAKGERRQMFELNERAALVATPFVGGRRSREGQKRIVAAFLHYRSVATSTSGPDLTNPGVLLGLLETRVVSSLSHRAGWRTSRRCR